MIMDITKLTKKERRLVLAVLCEIDCAKVQRKPDKKLLKTYLAYDVDKDNCQRFYRNTVEAIKSLYEISTKYQMIRKALMLNG